MQTTPSYEERMARVHVKQCEKAEGAPLAALALSGRKVLLQGPQRCKWQVTCRQWRG